MGGQTLCISTAFWSNSIRLSEAQLISMRIFGALTIIVAIFIFCKQYKMAKVQNALARYQGAIGGLTILQANKSPKEDIDEALNILQGLSHDLEKIDK